MRKNKPKSVRGALRRGWTVIEVKDYAGKNVSYLGLQIWTDRNVKGKYVSSFMPTQFAFELEKDANWFALRWS
jgi:hypothetical protein